ncbi:MOSC domain-containing protein [Kocuria sp.]|uniref:MOSC domain-containing protein n=1 Tax=Kocuria sp. TaxID=1871328 RepID=UPI0026E0FFE5|nr:MOSC domain-containing protein [Kocuria sp.]MDO5619811.1 hypothetical protein [Kocuria sp.]
MTVVVESLGLALVKGLNWSTPDAVEVVRKGVVGDRHWSPVAPDLRCIKATDFPAMVGLAAGPSEVPRADDVLLGGTPHTVRYYSRAVTARIFGGPLADRISGIAGQRLHLACAEEPGHFLWSSPVSLLLRSELGQLPDDVARYRANMVLDDRAKPLSLTVGSRLEVGGAVLEVERELERCVIINHHAGTGERDASLLGQLRPGLLLGYGCTVVEPGRVGVGDVVERRSPRTKR